MHLRKQHMDGSKYKAVDAACVPGPEKPTYNGSLTHSVHSEKAWILHRASLLTNHLLVFHPRRNRSTTSTISIACPPDWKAGRLKKSVRGGGNHEKCSPNTHVSSCTPALWWSRSLWCCRGLYLHKARSNGCKDRDITIWCSGTVYKAGQYKFSEVSGLCLDEKNGWMAEVGSSKV